MTMRRNLVMSGSPKVPNDDSPSAPIAVVPPRPLYDAKKPSRQAANSAPQPFRSLLGFQGCQLATQRLRHVLGVLALEKSCGC